MKLKLWLAWSAALLGLLVLGAYSGIVSFGPVRHSAQTFFAPLTRAGLSLGQNFSLLGESSEAERAKLQKQLSELQADRAELLKLKAENQELRSQLEFENKRNLQTTGASVLGFRQDGAQQLLLLNRGSNHGLEAEAGVLAHGFLIGQIAELSSDSSVVQLTTDSQFRAIVRAPKTQAKGIVRGQLGGLITMTRIPQDATLNSGDIIVTNNNQAVPRNLPLGLVKEVTDSENSVFKEAQLQLPFDIADLQTVFVIQ